MSATNFSKGNQFFRNGQFSNAVECYKRAIKERPDFPLYHEALQRAEQKQSAIGAKSDRQKKTSVNPKQELTSTRKTDKPSLNRPFPKSEKEQYDLIKSSKLVNPAYYRTNYSGSVEEGADCIKHYMQFGAKLGFNPCKRFNTNAYVLANPKVDFSTVNPLVHFICTSDNPKDGFDGETKGCNLITLKLRNEQLAEYDQRTLAFFGEGQLAETRRRFRKKETPVMKVISSLLNDANECVNGPIWSVTKKKTVAPSGNLKDYWHPAPYWWPNPDTPDGLPYVYKDGERVPGTRMYEPESDKYDRTSIQQVFNQSTICALSWYLTGDQRYAKRGCQLVRGWFIDPFTRMNPNLAYAQAVVGKNNNKGKPTGLIETKDFYYFLDAVRLLKRSEFWLEEDDRSFEEWLEEFLAWLLTSPQGKKECKATNNHGIAYDLQTFSIAAFLGQKELMLEIAERAANRLPHHFDEKGYQHREMERTTTAHYTAFNIQLWLNFALVLFNVTKVNLLTDVHSPSHDNKSPLALGINWLSGKINKPWPYQQIDEFDHTRYQPLLHIAAALSPTYKEASNALVSLPNVKARFFPHDGIAPYWAVTLIHGKKYDSVSQFGYAPYDKLEIRNRIVKHLWGGRSANATRDLEGVVGSRAYSGVVKGYAGWELSRWYAFKGRDDLSLYFIKKAIEADPRLLADKPVVLSKAFIELRAGRFDEARRTLAKLRKSGAEVDGDLMLALSNCYPQSEKRLDIINSLFNAFGYCGLKKSADNEELGITNVKSEKSVACTVKNKELISIIMPVFTAEHRLPPAVQSLLDQSLQNIEIIIVDDCSPDNTFSVARNLAAQDPRVRVLQLDKNSGAYAARNFGLRQARGEFITTHDADDWSHPQKLETQLESLRKDSRLMGVTVNWVRTTDDLKFTQNWRPATRLIHKSESSFMFRRKVLDRIGEWELVRVGGDNEYIHRMKNHFGEHSYKVIEPRVPLAFGLDDESSLTRTPATHVSSVYSGLRHIYREIWGYRQRTGCTQTLPLPGQMLPQGPSELSLSYLVVGDFSCPDTCSELETKVRAVKVDSSIIVGLFHVPCYRRNVETLHRIYFEMLIEMGCVPIVHCDTVRLESPSKLAIFEELGAVDALPSVIYRN